MAVHAEDGEASWLVGGLFAEADRADRRVALMSVSSAA